MDCIIIDDEDDDLEIIEDPNIDILDIAKTCPDKRFEVFEEDEENNETKIVDLSSESIEHLSSNEHDDNAQVNEEGTKSDIPLETPVNSEETFNGLTNDISSEKEVVNIKEEPIEIKREIENLNEYFRQMNKNEEEEDCVQVVHDNFRFEVLEEGPDNETHDLGTSTYFCEHCEFIATNNEQLLHHTSNVHNNGKCHLCEKILSSKRSLTRHIKLVHCKRKESVECLYCKRKLKKKGCIYRHMKYRHQRYDKHLEEGVDFRFITRKTGEKAPEKNTSESNSPVECLHCDAVYVGKKYLNRHMKIEHKIFPPLKIDVDFKVVPWPQGTLSTRCLHCRYIFKTINDLKQHAESKHKNYHSLKQGVDFEYIQQSLIESAVDNSRVSSPVEDSRCVENEKYSILESVGLQKKTDLESELLEGNHNPEILAELTQPVSKHEESCTPIETCLDSSNNDSVHFDNDAIKTLSPRKEENDNISEPVELENAEPQIEHVVIPQKDISDFEMLTELENAEPQIEHVLIPQKDISDSEMFTESNEIVSQDNEELTEETCLGNRQVGVIDTDSQAITKDVSPTKEEYEDNVKENITVDESNKNVEKLEEQTVAVTGSQNEEHNETVSNSLNIKDTVTELPINGEGSKNDSKPQKTKHTKKKEKKKFYCKYCAYKTVEYYNYLVHINRFDHEMRELYICPYCEKFTSYFRIEVKAHFREDHWDDHRSLRCPNCPFESKSYIRWIQHKKDHMKNIKKKDLLCYICNQCNYKTLFRTKLIKHTRIEHEKDDMLAKCVFCEYQGTINKLIKHLNNTHHKDCEIFNCSFCTHKADYLVKLEERCVENMDVSVICSFCDEEYPSQVDLEAHMKSSHKDICQMFICFQCNLGTNNERAFVKHLKATHDDGDCFYCLYCNFKTNLKHHLADHLAFEHRRSGKYIPVVESNLDGYKCEHCSFKSKRARCMMKHMEERHKYNLPGFYFCPRCGRKFKKLSGVERHLLKYHENSLSSNRKRKFNGSSKAEGDCSMEGGGENSFLKCEESKRCLVVKMTSSGEVTSTYIE